MTKPKPITKVTSIKFTPAQRKFLQTTARAQGHWHISKTVKRLVDREMGVT